MPSREASRTPRQVFGGMVRYYRERAGLSRAELARQICKSLSLVQAIELGQRAATVEVTEDLEPNIVIEVVPASTGAYLGVQGPFVIADFAGAPSVGYQEMALGAQPLEDPEQLALLDFTWNTLRSEALPRAASAALLEEAAKSWSSAR